MEADELTSTLTSPVLPEQLAVFELQVTTPQASQRTVTLQEGSQSLDGLFPSSEDGWQVNVREGGVVLERTRGHSELEFQGQHHSRYAFHPGDCFRLLQHVFWVVDVRNSYLGQLEGHSGDYKGTLWNLGFRPYKVGRRSSTRPNDIELNDPTVSRVQATLFPEDSGEMYLLSETSKSPVQVNGRVVPLEQTVRLNSGDVVLFGQLTFRYRQLSYHLFPHDGTLPKTIGGYRIVGKLGTGGMGVVYDAVDSQGKEVAIKVPLPNLVQDEEFIRRFNREMRLGSTLKHPRLTEIFHFEAAGEGRYPYLVMEKLPGSDLSGQPLPIPVARALDWTAELLEALEVLHGAGVVHRDLKPANLYLTNQGLKVADLGLAHLKDGLDQATQSGAILGTPAYLDPAVLRGHAYDPRTDLYAVGAILYEWVSGPLPYPAESLQIYRIKLSEDLPRLHDRAAHLPGSLCHFVDLLIHREPDRRFRSAQEALHALRELRDTDPALH